MTWEKKRREIYHITLAKFIRSLYHNKNNSLHSEGFVLASLHKNLDPDKQASSTFFTGKFLHSNIGQNDSYSISLLNADSLLSEVSTDKSRKFTLSDKQVLLVCYGRPVTGQDLNEFQYAENSAFLNNQALTMCLLHGSSIRIYPDGTYADNLQIIPVNTPNTIVKLNKILPLDYIPEELVLTAMENEFSLLSDSISRLLEMQLQVFPQEKLHLHTDRDIYIPGEKIWFKAYLADAATHQPSAGSRYVYVELISPADSLVSRVMLRPENGLFYGNIFLADMIPEGNYTLRAYTKYMENLGDDYFFKKNIRIGNIKNNYELKITNYENEPSGGNRKNDLAGAGPALDQNNYDVSFFPEGGNLVEGVICKIAFKALNRNGTPATVTGEIVDETGMVITSIQTCHAGMGVFACLPERGKRYYLNCRDGNGIEKKFKLPQSHPRAYALSVTRKDGIVSVVIHKSPYSLLFPAFSLHIAGERYSISHPGIAHMSPSLFRKQNYRQALFSLFCSTGR